MMCSQFKNFANKILLHPKNFTTKTSICQSIPQQKNHQNTYLNYQVLSRSFFGSNKNQKPEGKTLRSSEG